MPRALGAAGSNGQPARFCLVTPAHVCNNPRLVKEADALVEAGHAVRVVALDIDPDARRRDDILMSRRSWTLHRVVARRAASVRAAARWARAALAQRVARQIVDTGRGGLWLHARALSRYYDDLAAAASSAPADVVVAHNLEALPPAERAARRQGARLVFDIEDFYSGDVPSPEQHTALVRLLQHAERTYLPRCDALTASSEGIADEMVARYGVRRPSVILNAFALADRTVSPSVPSTRVGGAPSLYWFSQTIGPRRGLEEAVAALGKSGVVAHLWLRGAVSDDYRAHLQAIADAHGAGAFLHFAPTAPADEMVALAAEHDVGLAVEQPETRNKQLCVSNKLLTYFAAGIAIVATDIEGQRAILAGAPDAGVLYPPGDAAALAEQLRALLTSPGRLARAKRASARAAEERYSWERERMRLLAAHGSPPPAGDVRGRSLRTGATTAARR